MAILISKLLTFSLCKKLACARLQEAKILYKSRKYSGAYYLAGYAIELGIKAFYCKGIRKYTFPPDPQVVKDLYQHNLNKLMKACELEVEYSKDIKTNKSLQSNWLTVKDWGVVSRYSQISKSDSESMINSVEVIFEWIQTKWK